MVRYSVTVPSRVYTKAIKDMSDEMSTKIVDALYDRMTEIKWPSTFSSQNKIVLYKIRNYMT
jgi:hypothetical protein